MLWAVRSYWRSCSQITFNPSGGWTGDAPSPHCFINRGDSALDQRRLPSDQLALQRFEFELRVIALLVGPLYCLLDAVRSIARIWPRYFGRAPLPRGYGTKMFPKLLEAAKQRRLFPTYSHEYARDFHCSMADLALYGLVAMIMYKEWFYITADVPRAFRVSGSGPYSSPSRWR